jgi:hypothetical protein
MTCQLPVLVALITYARGGMPIAGTQRLTGYTGNDIVSFPYTHFYQVSQLEHILGRHQSKNPYPCIPAQILPPFTDKYDPFRNGLLISTPLSGTIPLTRRTISHMFNLDDENTNL